MCDQWMPVVDMVMTIDQFHRLPQNPAYKYEYYGGRAVLSPRPKFYHARLELATYCADHDLQSSEEVEVSEIKDDDFDKLVAVFKAAFHRQQPFASLDDETSREAAKQCLEKTWTGGDGPWLRQASLVARTSDDQSTRGAILITLMPEGDPADHDSYYWNEPPAEDFIEQLRGRAHLTWVFVAPLIAGRGIGTALITHSIEVLRQLGFKDLYSTFLAGNESSMLWHWRNGFELLSYPYSMRRMRREIEKMRNEEWRSEE